MTYLWWITNIQEIHLQSGALYQNYSSLKIRRNNGTGEMWTIGKSGRFLGERFFNRQELHHKIRFKPKVTSCQRNFENNLPTKRNYKRLSVVKHTFWFLKIKTILEGFRIRNNQHSLNSSSKHQKLCYLLSVLLHSKFCQSFKQIGFPKLGAYHA